jgi:serine/threonine protein kinase
MLRFGPYEVVAELGRGGMGVVYKGFDGVIHRDVAIKTIRLSDAADDNEREMLEARLRREAQSAGRLSHSSIVTVYQFGTQQVAPNGTVAYIVMEYVHGRTLASLTEMVQSAPFEWVLPAAERRSPGTCGPACTASAYRWWWASPPWWRC